MNQSEKKILTAEEMLLNSHIWLSGSSAKEQIIKVMEQYAAQQVQEMKEERDKAADFLDECRIQLEYLDKRFPTGTTPGVLSRVETFLNSLKQHS